MMECKSRISSEEKTQQPYLKQKELLDTFLEHHAISEEQYKKSFLDLTLKMGMDKYINLPE